MSERFVERLAAIQQANQSNLILQIAPRLSNLPLAIQRYDDPFLPFGKAIIKATRDVVCGYLFDLAAYMAIGAAGVVALERTIAYAGREVVNILHGPFASGDYSILLDEGSLNVDAVTLKDSDFAEAYLARPNRGVFVVRTGEADKGLQKETGVWWQDANLLTYPDKVQIMRLRLVEEQSLRRGQGDDFAEQIRARLIGMRHEND